MKEQLINFETAKLAYQKQFLSRTEYFYTEENGLCYIDTDGEVLNILNDDLTLKNHIYDCNGEFWFNEMEDEEGAFCQSYEPIKFYAPTQSLLQRWLREKHNIHISVNYHDYNFTVNIINMKNDDDLYYNIRGNYEQALEVGLLEALKLI